MATTKGQPVSKGFGVGLQIWLLFLISLYGLGYPALFSIALGAVGGIASGFIVDWWSKEENIVPTRKPASDTGVEEETRLRKRRRNSALGHRKRQREREPVTVKTITNLFQRSQDDRNEDNS